MSKLTLLKTPNFKDEKLSRLKIEFQDLIQDSSETGKGAKLLRRAKVARKQPLKAIL